MTVKAKTVNAATTSGNKGVKVKPAVQVTALRPRHNRGAADLAFNQLPDNQLPGPAETQSFQASRPTPYERLRGLLASAPSARRVISSVEDLQAFLKEANGQSETVTLRMKLLWVSDHTYRDFKLVRLHFVDADSPEPLQDQVTLFRGRYETDRDAVNSVLLTTTMWNMSSESKDLPQPGSVVTINDYTNLKLFRDTDCQATIRLRDLTWESA